MYNSALKKVEQTIGIVCLLTMFTVICFNVVMRYAFSQPLYWAEELSNYMFVWIGFLSCANSVADNKHIRVTAFIDLLSERARRWLALLMDGLLLAVFGVYILPSWRALDSLHISTGLQIQERYPYAILPFVMTLCCLHVVLHIARDVQDIATVTNGEPSWH
jgi:TRAP-type C4-dicarboxylate transport system permease small subunit